MVKRCLIGLTGISYNPDYGIVVVAIVITTLPSVFIFFLLEFCAEVK